MPVFYSTTHPKTNQKAGGKNRRREKEEEKMGDDGIMKYNKMGLFFLIKRAFLSLVTPKQSDSLSLLNIHLFFFFFSSYVVKCSAKFPFIFSSPKLSPTI